MGRKKEIVDGKLISVTITQKDYDMLQSKGINMSSFVRQAITAHNKKKWSYDYIEWDSKKSKMQ